MRLLSLVKIEIQEIVTRRGSIDDSLSLSLIDDVINLYFFFFFQAEDGIRDCLLSRGLGDVYKDRTTGYLIPEQPP